MTESIQWVWTYHIKHKFSRLYERFLVWIAWHLSKELVKWCFIRVASHATKSNEHPDTISIMKALERWSDE